MVHTTNCSQTGRVNKSGLVRKRVEGDHYKMRTSSLTEKQRRIVEGRARENGFSCYFCRSSDPESRRVAEPEMGGFVSVVVECASCGDGTSVVRFSAEETGELLKLDHSKNMRDFPEADGGGRAPRGYQ